MGFNRAGAVFGAAYLVLGLAWVVLTSPGSPWLLASWFLAVAVVGSFIDVGVNGAFVRQVRTEVHAGTSALFVFSNGATVDAMADALSGLDVRLVRSDLTDDEETELRAIFTEEEATG